ncbi:MAG: hypothetical protein ACP5OR_02855 [Candidatus Dormibacteria bacterium]
MRAFRSPRLPESILALLLVAMVFAVIPAVPVRAAVSWGTEPSANTSSSLANELSDLSYVSATDCWSVGWADNASGYAQTLTEEWNGS